MNISCREIGNVTVVNLSGRLYSLSADDFQKYGDHLIEKHCRSMVLNLQGVEYISSGGLRALIYLTKKMKKQGHELILTELQPKVEDIIDMSGLGAVFTITEELDDAMEQCRKGCVE